MYFVTIHFLNEIFDMYHPWNLPTKAKFFKIVFLFHQYFFPPTIRGLFSACLTTFVFLKILSKVDCLPLLNYLPNWPHVINLLQSFPPGSIVCWNKDMMRRFWVILLAPLLNRFQLCWILFQMKRPTYFGPDDVLKLKHIHQNISKDNDIYSISQSKLATEYNFYYY